MRTRTELPPDLTVRVNRQARRITLKLDVRGQAVLVLPDERLRAAGLRFAEQKRDWLDSQRARLPVRIPFEEGETIPVRGTPRHIVLAPTGRDPIQISAGAIRVAGRSTAVAVLVQSWLKAEARADLLPAVAKYASALHLPTPSVTLRDPKTRWGSCSSKSTISLSWRLILAPSPVLDYVAAHEVAHLVELNHSPRFWKVVSDLCPGFREQERWLDRHGRGLHRYG
jgi:predicted metal-dependent hydrolase